MLVMDMSISGDIFNILVKMLEKLIICLGIINLILAREEAFKSVGQKPDKLYVIATGRSTSKLVIKRVQEFRGED
jgi:hypothetical protein